MYYAYRTYILIFTVVALVSSIVIFFDLICIRSLGCDCSGYTDDTFLAFCGSGDFGDYEHGAFYYALEPKAIENLRKADVVILGNSTTMFAFSTSAIDHFFKGRGIRYFLLGFGYNESNGFPLAVMQRYGIKPKMLIINADNFFTDTMSPVATEITGHKINTRLKYFAKRMMQSFHKQVCSKAPMLCSPKFRSIYRSSSTGRWVWEATFNTNNPIPFIPPVSSNDATASKRAALIGEQFIKALPLSMDRRCVVLTGVPHPANASEAMASSLAKELHTSLLNVSVEGMSTIDGVHLDARTAERWSKAFVSQLEPLLSSCACP